MNGIHDMGGLHGFGPVEVEPDEPVFHARWEARVFGIVQSLPGGNIDAGRHSIECLDPVSYLKDGYYGRWFGALVNTLADLGIVSTAQLEARMRRRPRPHKRSRAVAPTWRPQSRNYARPIAATPAFRVGQDVVTKNHQPAGHTRLPAYARLRPGVITRVHAAMVFPDDHAHGRGENPQYLYTVRFDGGVLWGDSAEPATVIHVDLFESYLDAV
jgi:nitrile hydratase